MKYSGSMIGTENATALGQFYTQVLGEPGFHQDDWYGWDDGAQLMIGPHSEVNGKSQNPQRILLSFTVDDVKAEFDRLKGVGATVVAEPYQPDPTNTPDMWLATLADPDGNYMQISLPWKE